MIKNKRKGFSLIELVIVIAILAILIAVLAPSLMTYTERSRAQKDVTTMDEVVNAVQLAMADQKCYDEMLRYSCSNNFITYSDSSGNYGQQIIDAEYWAPDGAGKATTITFNPEKGSDGKTIYQLENALVNDMTYGNGSIAQPRQMIGYKIDNNQCYLKNASLNGQGATAYLYNRVRQIIGDNVITTSATYANSSFTIFIRFNQKDGVTVADVNGAFNGTNLHNASYSAIGSGTNTEITLPNGDKAQGDATTPNGGKVNISHSASDLIGGGSFSGNEEYKNNDPKPVGESGTLSAQKLGDIIAKTKPKKIYFVYNGESNQHDVSEEQNGSIFAMIQNDTLYVYSAEKDKSIKMPENCKRFFSGIQYPAYQNVELISFLSLNTDQTTNMYSMFSAIGQNANSCHLINLQYLNTENVTDFSYCFSEMGMNANDVLISGINSWNLQSAVSMPYMFNKTANKATTFNIGKLDRWNTSSVKQIHAMFFQCAQNAKDVNIGDIGKWDVSNAASFSMFMYEFGELANTYYIGDLSNWNVGNSSHFATMFYRSGSKTTNWYIGDLSNWNTAKGTSFNNMFNRAGRLAANWTVGDLSNWNTSKAQNMNSMFQETGIKAKSWHIGDIGKWDVSKVTNFNNMFFDAAMNVDSCSPGDLSKWDVSNAETMEEMFQEFGSYSNNFNIGDISSWNTSNVTNMYHMFLYAGREAEYELDLTKWDVSSVIRHDDFSHVKQIKDPIWIK